jgi:protocatechuate 3,4-dioxygenase beta subunit
MTAENATKRDWTTHPPYNFPPYASSVARSPREPLIPIKHRLLERSAPVYGHESVGALDSDLTKNGAKTGEPLGERIIVTGRVLDEDARPVRNTLVEIWQANAAGRYIHKVDQHAAPLDPNFLGAGRVVTDDEGRYKFYTIKPGAYPWGNHHNAWRPNHIHFSLVGNTIASRLVTQMYFPGDPLLNFDPIYQSSPVGVRERMVAGFSLDVTEEGFALGYVFDIVLRGRSETPFEA